MGFLGPTSGIILTGHISHLSPSEHIVCAEGRNPLEEARNKDIECLLVSLSCIFSQIFATKCYIYDGLFFFKVCVKLSEMKDYSQHFNLIVIVSF